MSSWTLGKIFTVDETHAVDEADQDLVDGEDSSDSDEDGEALDRAEAFNKSKRSSGSVADSINGSTTGSIRNSIRRYDEYGDFISRSERARAEKSTDDKQKPASVLKDTSGRQLLAGKGEGHVSFRSGTDLLQVKEVEPLSDDDKTRCFMTQENWQSIDTDIEITTKRWKNHLDGKIKFDEDNNTVRGIEDLIFNINKARPMYRHRRAILEELVRQKTSKEYPNWEKLRAVSEQSSAAMREQAVELGKEDEKEKDRVWSPKTSEPAKVIPTGKKDKSKRKSSFFGFLKKK